ncbi:CDGSH iron-sulfur domain-containing protein [Parabacteroides sp. PF5-9]|uniref:CDGSH iron-sulfur domain-containing protein n=1 Tax=Parabacteroides sp. PF5-9 TaxID=1742404 RepID=UPI002476176E|nr:CDGSH iron-sulfur domain-containing protein [Parabacteroides sp. PF5-9]MDH6358675.1 CDGSH-type Zn-finger protein [Parabacteroides sp. PF5-9]
MNSEKNKKIKVLPNGPYQVSGHVSLNQLRFVADRRGASTAYKEIQKYETDETFYLCRCGNTKNYPFCDGSHLQGFEGTETAGFKTYDEMAKIIKGDVVDLMDAEELCGVARFCDTHGSTWNLVEGSNNPESVEVVKHQCCNCPSGRLTVITKDGKRIEPELQQEISLLEDTAASVHGPIWVKGGMAIESAEDKIYPIRNRVTLCRCGKSQNKPFCDAMHMHNKGELMD